MPSPVVKRIFDMAEGRHGHPRHHPDPQRRGHLQPQGKALAPRPRRPQYPYSTRRTRAHWSGAPDAKDKARRPCGWRRHFPAIVSKARVPPLATKLLSSRAPKRSHPRRVGSSYLLSGLVRCETCVQDALTGQVRQERQVLLLRLPVPPQAGQRHLQHPQAQRPPLRGAQVVAKIRANVLTESNIRELVKLVDEEMDGVAAEQRQRLETIEEELEDVKKKAGAHLATTSRRPTPRWPTPRTASESTGIGKEKLEVRRWRRRGRCSPSRKAAVPGQTPTPSPPSPDMSEFLNDQRADRNAGPSSSSFVKEVVVKPGKAAIVYSIPTPDDSPIGGADAAEVALNGRVLTYFSTRHGGPGGTRTFTQSVISRPLCL